LSQSAYRFMVKMQNLTKFEEEIVKFLRRAFQIKQGERKDEMERFYSRIKKFENNPLQARVFVYLDIVSWVESKVYRKPFDTVVQEKYRSSKRAA
jgi:hypothetical protein